MRILTHPVSIFKRKYLSWDLANSKQCVREGSGTPLQYSCLENPVDGRAWWAAVHEVAKSRTRLSNFIFTFHFHALEKEMATHSSVLAWRIPAWRIPGMGEPGGLPSMGLYRVRDNWSDLAAAKSVYSVYVCVCMCVLHLTWLLGVASDKRCRLFSYRLEWKIGSVMLRFLWLNTISHFLQKGSDCFFHYLFI